MEQIRGISVTDTDNGTYIIRSGATMFELDDIQADFLLWALSSKLGFSIEKIEEFKDGTKCNTSPLSIVQVKRLNIDLKATAILNKAKINSNQQMRNIG